MVQALPLNGVLRVVPPATLEQSLQREAVAKYEAQNPSTQQVDMSSLAGFITKEYEMMKRHRDDAVAGWSERLLHALRTFNGKYDPQKLQEIKRFKGSEVYARIIAMK